MAVGDDTTLVIPPPGEIGDLETWSVGEAVTPFVVGDPAASGGSITAQVKSHTDPNNDSVFTLGRTAVLTAEHNSAPDSISGQVQSVQPVGLSSVSLTLSTVLSQLSAERVADPQWADKSAASFTVRGPAPGQIGDPQGIAVDVARDAIYIQSFISGVMRLSKFTLNFDFVSEYVWTVHSGRDGGMQVAVLPSTGDVFVLDPANEQYVRFDSDLTFIDNLWVAGTPTAISPAPDGVNLLIGRIAGTVPEVCVFFPTGGLDYSVLMPGPRHIPTSIAVHPITNDVYVGSHVSDSADGVPAIIIYNSLLGWIGQISYSSLHGRVV